VRIGTLASGVWFYPTDSWLLHKIRVSCSAYADWQRAQVGRALLLNPAFSPTQVRPGRGAERQLTREKQVHGSALKGNRRPKP